MLESKILVTFVLLLTATTLTAETISFEIDEIQQFVSGPNAVHPMEYPVGELEGLTTVEFAIAYVNEHLVFYAAMDESLNATIEFNVVAELYHNHNQKIGYINLRMPTVVLPKSELSGVGANFFKVEGNAEQLKISDLVGLENLRLEVTWFDRVKV